MAKNKIDWDLWLDKPYAKLWIATIVVMIISVICAVITFILGVIALSNKRFNYLGTFVVLMSSMHVLAMLLFVMLQNIYEKKKEKLFKSWRKK